MRQFPRETALTIALTALLLAGVHAVAPAVRAPQPAQISALLDFTPDGTPVSPLALHREPAPPPTLPRTLTARPSPLLDDSNQSLDHFYQALWETEKGGPDAVTRVVHYGDSPTTADLVTGEIRRLLQKRFGDAGHGFILVSKPWAWYQHQGTQLMGAGWKDAPASRFGKSDGLFGLGGVSFTGSEGASSQIVFEGPGYSRFEVWYLRQPGGGTLSVWADGKPLGTVDTAGDAREAAFASFTAAAGATELALQVDRGTVRVFGVTADKSGPGIIYDSLGLNGASVVVLTQMFNQQHWTEELRHRNPDLFVLNYGTNEADFAKFVDSGYEPQLRAAIARIRQALPEASILLMSPMDRGQRAGGGAIETMATIPRIVETERRVARDTGCGFFDTFSAMGGEGTMAKWYAAQPRLVSADFIHPYPAGGKIVATAFVKELNSGLNRYKQRRAGKVNRAKLK